MEPHDYRMYYVNIDLHHEYGISSMRNIPSGEERGETDVFAGYVQVAYERQFFQFFGEQIARRPAWKRSWCFPHAVLFPGKYTID